MKIIRTTDNLHLGEDLISSNGEDIIALNKGDKVNLSGFLFEVQEIKTISNGNILLSNPNYQIELEV